MHHLYLDNWLSIITNAALTSSDTAADILLYLLLLNGRAFILLLCCLFILKIIKGSAATRHFLATVSIVAIALLPLTSRLIPAFDITVETSYLQEIEAEISTVGQTPVSGYRKVNLFTPDLFYFGCLALYFLGFTIILARMLLDNLRLFLLIKLCRPITPKNWLDAIEKHRINLGISRRIELRYSDFNASPSTWGAFRPVVLLPSSALQWPSHLIESTVLHELAHIKRYDWLVQQIARCICAFYWLNPLCWIAVNRIFTHAETACDDLAINSGVPNLDYAESLVDVAEQALLRHQNYRVAAPAMASHEKHSQLGDRVLTILNQHECRAPISRMQIISALLAFLCVLLPLTSVRAKFVEHVVEVAPQPAIFEEQPVHTAYSPVDYISAIPIDLVPKEAAIKKTEYDSPGKRLAELKQILETDNVPPEKNAATTKDADIPEHASNDLLPQPRELSRRLSSANTGEVVKKQAQKLLTAISQNHVDQQPAENTPVEYKKNILSHSPINMVIPEYPYRARYRGIEGEVTVEYSIDEYGNVVEAEIVSAYPSTIFNRNVLRAIKSSIFNPRQVDGKPVRVNGLVEKYLFVLES